VVSWHAFHPQRSLSANLTNGREDLRRFCVHSNVRSVLSHVTAPTTQFLPWPPLPRRRISSPM